MTLILLAGYIIGQPLSSLAAWGDTDDDCKCAKPDAAKNRIIIDASTGDIKGKRKFAKSERVDIIVINKNPFLYRYEVTINEEAVKEPAISAFLALLGGPVSDVLESPEATRASDKAGERISSALRDTQRIQSPCLERLFNSLRLLDEIRKRAQSASAAAVSTSNQLIARHKEMQRKYEEGKRDLLNPNAGCEELCRASKEFLKNLDGRVKKADLDDLLTKTEALQASAQFLKDTVKSIRTEYTECLNGQEDLLTQMALIAEGLLSQSKECRDRHDLISKDNKVFEKDGEAVGKVIADPSSFQETHFRGDFDATTNVKVVVSRKLRDEDGNPKPFVSATLKFGGGPFFTLSAGIVFSPLRKEEFQRTQGFARNRDGSLVIENGAEKFTSIIDFKENSHTRIGPLVMLNGRLASDKWIFDGIHASLGVTAKNDNKGTDIEFLVGPSFSSLDNQLFFTLGGYAGRSQKLAGDIFPGAEVPKDLAEAPVRKNYRWHFGFAITYKIK